ncbi:MAG: hypothetical protein HUK19_02500, partial [Fibrobacter sp.]|nr:hypothetical protein [Fibrobacter sp.]
KEYTFVFAMEEDSDDAAQFAFNLGQVTGAVKISDVKLVFTTANPGSETDPSSSASEPGSSTSTISMHFDIAQGNNFLVFDMQGRLMGSIELSNGTSLQDALKAQFGRAGVYMLKQSNGRMFTTQVK